MEGEIENCGLLQNKKYDILLLEINIYDSKGAHHGRIGNGVKILSGPATVYGRAFVVPLVYTGKVKSLLFR